MNYYKDHPKTNIYPLNLHDYGGLFAVVDGQARVMAAKALGIETLPARVAQNYPTAISINSDFWYRTIQQRQKDGLWQGSLSFELDTDLKFLRGEAQVYSYEGYWVFAEHMEEVKKVYQTVGASGQAKPLF